LGEWLRRFHDKVKLPEQSGLRAELKFNGRMQYLKNTINYTWLLDRVDRFPSILEDAKPIFEEVQNVANAELEDESKLQVIHGGSWTGKHSSRRVTKQYRAHEHDARCPPPQCLHRGWPPGSNVYHRRSTWRSGPRSTVGQIIAELYEITLFKNISAGVWMIEGLRAAYETLGADLAFRTAIQAGIHLLALASWFRDGRLPNRLGMG